MIIIFFYIFVWTIATLAKNTLKNNKNMAAKGIGFHDLDSPILCTVPTQ